MLLIPSKQNIMDIHFMGYSTLARTTLLMMLLASVVTALRDVEVFVPAAVRRGETTRLHCMCDLEGDTLYAVKWYKGRREFYRYTPKENPAMKTFPVNGISVLRSASNESQVALRDVQASASGKYSCEVSADAPSFHTEIATKDLDVVDVPEHRPIVHGIKSRYKIGDSLRANCSSKNSKPAANLTWTINDVPPRTTISEGLGENTMFSGNSRGKNKYFFWGKQWPTETHRYCGNGLPIDYLSSTVFVRFKSNDLIEKSGFKFTAQSLPDCARNYTKPQGRLYSRSKVDCETYINVPENYTITLYFTSVDFNYEGDCSGNNIPLKVYNARNDEVLESYCGDSRPKPLFTTTNSLKLKFNGHHMTNGMEFYDITYLATDKGRGCGGELYSYGGTLASPGYPNTDRNNSDCTWTINVPMNLLVAVQFGVFDMGSKATCELNYVELIESDESIPSTKFCGTDSPAPYRSRSNQLKIHFKNSLNFAGTGWVVNFMALHEHSDLNQFM